MGQRLNPKQCKAGLSHAIANAIMTMCGGVLMYFREIVKTVRQRLNITQEQLAHCLTISFSTINRWENGHTLPSKLAKMRFLEFCEQKNIDKKIIDKLKES